MTKRINFGDHGAFHRQVARTTIAGAALGAFGFVGERVLGAAAGGGLTVAWMALVVATLGLAARPPEKKRWYLTIGGGLALGAIGALVLRTLIASPPVYPWFGAAIWGSVVGLLAGRDLRDHRRWALPLATAVSVTLASWVLLTLSAKVSWASHMPVFFAAAVKGSIFGFIAGMGLIVRQLHLAQDPVERRYAEIKPQLTGELAELAAGALTTYGRISEVLRDRQDRGTPTDPELERGVQQLVTRILELGTKWQEVERESGRTSREGLVARIEGLEAKIAVIADSVAGRQYTQAKTALEAQLRYLDDINTSRERVLARVHNYAATLERVNLAVVNNRGADAAKFSSGLTPLMEEIEEIGQEMDFAAEAASEVAEVEAETATEALEGPPAPQTQS